MLTWATEFPLAVQNACADILRVGKTVLATSPHSAWQVDSFGEDPTTGLKTVEVGGHTATIGCAALNGETIAGLQERWIEHKNREWVTEVVGYEYLGRTTVSVRVSCDLRSPGLQLPNPKKPYVVGQILEELGGGSDGGLTVQAKPHLLAEVDVDVAARLMGGASETRLPVVYVSVGRLGRRAVDSVELARWLGGMAHVVVEPSRHFSFALARNTEWRNAYGGAVGIYWPSADAGQVRYLPYELDDSRAMQSEIVNRVRRALTHVGTESRCTFQHLQEFAARAQVEHLRAEGSTALDDYVELFDSEIKAKEERLITTQEELARVKGELYRYEQAGTLDHGMIAGGQEREFYLGERRDAVIHTLRRGRDGLVPGGRLQHLVDDVLKENKCTGKTDEIEAEIKEAFRQSGDLGQKQRRTLEELGFECTKAGRHWKVTYQGDDRYTFRFPKAVAITGPGRTSQVILLRNC